MERFAPLGKSCAPFARGDWNAASRAYGVWAALRAARRVPLRRTSAVVFTIIITITYSNKS